MAASQEQPHRIASNSSNWARQLELSYVLIADANSARARAALETVKRFKVAILVARDGLQAIETVRRFGAPKLLIVDLSLPRKDGIAVIDAARGEPNRTTEIVAWADREPSQFAGERLSRMKVRTLRGPVSDVALAEAIESALERMTLERVPVTPTAGVADPEPSQYLDRLMRGLAESARLLCGTAGAAVYVRALGETKFRAFVTWACDAAGTASMVAAVTSIVARRSVVMIGIVLEGCRTPRPAIAVVTGRLRWPHLAQRCERRKSVDIMSRQLWGKEKAPKKGAIKGLEDNG